MLKILKMKYKFPLFGLIGILLFSCKPNQSLQTIDRKVDLTRYAGKWYEIAKLPNSFQKNCDCATAQYSLKDNGQIEVLNTCIKPDGSIKDITGKAKSVSDSNDKLKVSFFPLIWGDYQILDLDENYQTVLVGEPGRKYLWILARTENISNTEYNRLISKAKSLGFPTENVVKSKRDCQ